MRVLLIPASLDTDIQNMSRIKHIILKPFVFFKNLSWKKKLLVVILLIAGAIGISSYLNANKKPEYESAKAEKGDIVEIVSETGNIIASGKTNVYSPTNGVVTEILVQNGDIVKDGDTLFTVDSSASEQEKQAAYATYLTAVSSLNAEKAKIHALQSAKFQASEAFLNDRGVDNPTQDQKDDPVYIQQEADWKKAEADYINQQAVINQAQAHVSAAWTAYQATQNAIVKAPLSGMVSNLSINTGSSVFAESPTQTTKPALALTAVSENPITEVEVSLSETDIAKIENDQEATIDVVAVDDKTYKGKVIRYDTIGTDVQGVIRYNVYLQVLNPDEDLRSGMNVDVDIVTNKLDDVLSVPNAAVKPYQGGRAVRVYDEAKKEIVYIPVEIGVRGEERTQILKGLTQGQEVIISLSNEALQRPGLFGGS